MSPGRARFGRRVAVVVALMAMLAPFSIDTYLPSFPAIGEAFAVSQTALQQTLSVYLLAFSVTTLLHGPLSDAFGRRTVVLWALAGYCASSVVAATAESFTLLLVARVGQGLTASAGLVIGRAMIRDAFDGARAQRVLSRVMLMFAIAPALAPMIGGWLHGLAGWRAVFWFLAALGAALWLLVRTGLPETLAREGRVSAHPFAIGRVYLRVLAQPRFLALVGAWAIGFGGFFLYVAGAPVVVFDYLHGGAADFWWLFVPIVAGVMLGSLLSGRVAAQWTHQRTVGVGLAVMSVAAVANLLQSLWLSPGVWATVAPVTLYCVGMSLSMPSFSLLALEYFPRNRGAASAVQGFLQTLSSATVAGALVPLVVRHPMQLAAAMLGLHLVARLLWRLADGGRAPA